MDDEDARRRRAAPTGDARNRAPAAGGARPPDAAGLRPVDDHARRRDRTSGACASSPGRNGAVRRADRRRSRAAGCPATRRLHVFAARFLDFAVLTDRAPRVLLDRLLHPPAAPAGVPRAARAGSASSPRGPEPYRTLRIVGDFSQPDPARAARRPDSLDVRDELSRDAVELPTASRPDRERHGPRDCDRPRRSRTTASSGATPPIEPELRTVTLRHRDRRGHHRRPRVRGRRPTAARGRARTASSRSTSRSRAGSSTTPTTSGASRIETLAEVAARARRGRRDRRRDRHHEPARDRRRVGPRAPAGRGTGRSCGRTAAPRRAATSCAPRATSR